MEIPAFFYGLTRDVKQRCKKGIAAFRKGAELLNIIESDNTISTEDHDGLLVLDGPSSLVGGEPHFHVYGFIRAFMDDSDVAEDQEKMVFKFSLEAPWGLMGILGGNHTFMVVNPERHAPFLRACLKYWKILLAEGNRYTFGSNAGMSLNELPTNLEYVLVNNGIPQEELIHRDRLLAFDSLIQTALSNCGP